jgi:glutathione S-transferase
MTHLHYFKGRGRAETTRWMLAINRIEFENAPIETPEALAALRASGKLPFDQMPLLEINGLKLSQSSAMMRYLARLGGFYGESDIEAVWCDMIVGTAADLAEAAMQAPFQPTKEMAIAAIRARFDKFGPKFEARLTENGSGFCVGGRMTFADVILAEALNAHLEWCPDILANTPLLAALYERVLNDSGVSNYLSSAQRYPRAGDNYVIDIARVLQRALPPHMPHSGRFVLVA